MQEVESKLRNWGRSIGLVIPKEVIIKEGLEEGDTINFLIVKKSNPIKNTFGILRSKVNTAKLLKEVDKELWDD